MSRVRDALKKADSWQQEQPNQAPVQPLPRVVLDFAAQTPALVSDPEVSVPSAAERFVGLVREWLGLRRKGAPVPRCSGSTRKGLPCRAPAMANGYCRMHGGSRRGRLRRVMQAFQERMGDAVNGISEP
jgi:hypothetical protein